MKKAQAETLVYVTYWLSFLYCGFTFLIELFETEDDLPTAIMYIVIKENQSHETSN